MEVAARLALEKGIDGINISSIAKACDLSRPTIYRYFKTKEDILWAIFFQQAHQMQQKIAHDFSSDDDLFTRTIKVAQGMIDYQLQNDHFIIYNDIFLFLYVKASEDIHYDWDKIATNIYHFKPGHTIKNLYGDLIDIEQDESLKYALVSFIYAISYLMQAILRQDEALQVKYKITAKEILNKQVFWLLEGIKKELEDLGYPTSVKQFQLQL